MKILILTVTAGGGHNSTAEALRSRFEKRGAEAVVLDTYGAISRPIKWIIAKGYLFVAERMKRIYAGGYRLGEKRKGNSYRGSAMRFLNRIMSKNIRKYIDSYQPDAIVYTHVFCGGILDVIRQRRGLKAKTVGVVTDFLLHPYWEETLRMDYIVTANELLEPSARLKGYRPEQILPFGIPIKEKFEHCIPKEQARRMLGLDVNTRTVMIMSGSMGYSNLIDTVKILDRIDVDMQIICVCGSNEKAKKQIDELKTSKKILNFGFADNVDVLMDASDCLITKPGGLTSSEALAKRLPMIICDPSPGQEDRNSEFLQNNGVAMRVSDTYSVAYAIYQLFRHERRLELMREAIDMIRKPDSTRRVCEFTVNLIEQSREAES